MNSTVRRSEGVRKTFGRPQGHGTGESGLSALQMVLPTDRHLAQRHVGCGVQPQHDDRVGIALIWALEQGLGTALTTAAREAWVLAQSTLVGAMKAAAHPQQVAA